MHQIDINETIKIIGRTSPVTKIEKSVEYPNNFQRYTFSLYDRPNERVAINALKYFLDILQFGEQYDTILHVARLIETINETKKYPLWGAGFSLQQNYVSQLKIYYMLSIFEQETEGAKPMFDDKKSKKIVRRLLREFEMKEDENKIIGMIEYMAENHNPLHIIGLNIEKHKPLALKIYFRMGSGNE